MPPRKLSNCKPPARRKNVRICLVVHEGGVKFYGNRAAFSLLARWMEYISASPSEEYHELHTAFHLSPPGQSIRESRNVLVLFEEPVSDSFQAAKNGGEFDVNFMAVQEKDLELMERWRARRRVPKGWVAGRT